MSNDSLLIAEQNIGDKTVELTVRGQITAATAEKLKKKFDEVIQKKNTCIIANMSGVSFLSSGGIRILLMYFKIMKGNGGKLYVKDPSENVRNVLGMVALDEMLYR